jgi:hypothetical protein
MRLPLLILIAQFVCLGGDHNVSPVMELQPLLEFQVLVHPAPTRVENQEAKLQRPSVEEVLFDELLPLECNFLRDTSEPISRQIDEVELSADPVKIYQLRAARFRAGKRQTFLAGKAIEQARLAYVAPSQKRNFRERLDRELLRPRCTGNKFGFHQDTG